MNSRSGTPTGDGHPAALAAILEQLQAVKPSGGGWTARCPAHDDTNPSLSVRVADDGKLLVHCFAGCSTERVMEAIGLTMACLAGSTATTRIKSANPRRSWTTAELGAKALAKGIGTVEAIYAYEELEGTCTYKVARIREPNDKTFRPLHLMDGRWHLGDPDRLLPLYRLPEIVTERTILVVEGEKCVLQAEALGVRATTSAHGAKSAKKSDWNPLANKMVVVWPDSDKPGLAYANDAALILRTINPDAQVRMIKVNGLPKGGDIVDWVDQMRSEGLLNEQVTERLTQLIEAATPFPATGGDSADSADSAQGGPESHWQAPRPIVDQIVLPKFPLDAVFPSYLGRLKDYVIAVADCYQVPTDAVALLLLPVMALALSKRFEVEPIRGWREQLSLYVLVLLPSGERKTAVIRELLAPIYAWQREKASGMADAILTFENQETIARQRLEQARKKAAKTQSIDAGVDDLAQKLAEIEGKKPLPPSLIATDGTTEAIARALVLNQERCMLAAAEGDALDIMMGRYSGSPNFGVWLSGHSGDAVDSIRRGREPDRLVHPALQVALCVQPEAVTNLFGSQAAHGRGVVARFFISMPESKVGFRELLTEPIPSALVDYFGTRVQSQLEVPVPSEPTLIRFSPEAHEVFTAYRRQNELDLRPDGALAMNRAWGSKLPGGLARVAGILRAFEPNLPLEIDVETLRCALALSHYLTVHYNHIGALGGDDATIDLAQRIDAWIRRDRRTQFTKRDAFNQVKSRAAQVEAIEPALALLQERHRIALVPSTPKEGPGRPASPIYLVNPALVHDPGDPAHNSHNPQNSDEGGA